MSEGLINIFEQYKHYKALPLHSTAPFASTLARSRLAPSSLPSFAWSAVIFIVHGDYKYKILTITINHQGHFVCNSAQYGVCTGEGHTGED